MKNAWIFLVAACALVITVYAYMTSLGVLELVRPSAEDAYYNLLVQGFRASQLNLKREVPTGLTQLADPYDPAANILYQKPPYRLHDLSYYKGKVYSYWGVTPALILFWPFVAMTGHYVSHSQAVTIFCALGFLASVALLRGLWRRYFTEVSVGVVAACALGLGLATGAPVLLSLGDVYEVAISCGYMLTMLSLGAIWCALHQSERRGWWLAVASVAYGLAVGARPNLLFGAIMLLVPVAQAWRERRQVAAMLLAATGPILLIGLGLMYYNFLRFDNPVEFGLRYQLGGTRQVTHRLFDLHYLWFNFRIYFLEPARWSVRSPFVREIIVPPVPPGHGGVDGGFGILTNIPLVWLALAAPLAWRNRSGLSGPALRWFATAVALLFGMCAVTLGLFRGANGRYEVEFLPALLLLAVVGILGSERTLAPTSESGQADRPVWLRAARWGWGLLLGFSVAFNLLASVGHYAEGYNDVGTDRLQQGRPQEAIEQYEQALRINPDYATAHNNLGNALLLSGNVGEAIRQYEQAVRLIPGSVEVHCDLGTALEQAGRTQEAIEHFEEALRIDHNCARAHYNLGVALARLGKGQQAIEHFEQALRIQPDYAEAHLNLGNALLTQGKLQDAVWHYGEALRIKPDYPQAHDNLGIALAQTGMMPEAMKHWEEALRYNPDDIEAHYNLGLALEKMGRVPEAVGRYEQALRINPDFVQARQRLERLQAH
jgi:tetratricopeptide (TPR) repeat protein